MPQSRRKVAFSGKKKKEQIQAHRKRKLARNSDEEGRGRGHKETVSYGEASLSSGAEQDMSSYYHKDIISVNQQPGANTRVNRYNLKFRRETDGEKEKRRAMHSRPIQLLLDTELESSSEYFYPPGLSYPSRPAWSKNMSKKELEMSENKHFRLFCEKIDREFADRDLSMYELNLETWRQLWRVTEMSDVLLIIVDARFPVAQFPPYLYIHLVEKENKGAILLLNKCDLLPPSVIVAWERYFSEKFPKLLVVPFSSVEGVKSRRNLLKMAAESALGLVEACQKLVGDAVNLDSWRDKIEEERNLENEVSESCEITETHMVNAQSTVPEMYQRFRDGVLTVGTIGHPNVGKSSLINALMGKKVVSVSRTPGHTKHFQTIFLTKNIKLCDCPGLVFPSTVNLPLQVLLGSYPIAQVRDPINIVHYIAERLDVPRILKLKASDEMEGSNWTSYYICEAWAEKRGYHTRSKGIVDVSRAANELLRFCLTGFKSLVFYLRPQGYANDRETFESDPKTEKVKLIQGFHAVGFEDPILEDNEEEEEVEKIEEENVEYANKGGQTQSGSEEEEREVEEEREDNDDDDDDDDDCTAMSVHNKFAHLPDCE